VRKLGVPGYEELAMGAIASGNVIVLNEDVMRSLPNADGLLEE
jgi:predicted phosphoribosyltransferase